MQRACAPLRSLSLRRRRSTRASEARMPRCASGTRSVRCVRALPEREAALLAAQGRAPMCQPLSSLSEVGCECSALARHCARSLLGGGAARALATCAPRCAGGTRCMGCGRALPEREAALLAAQGRAPMCQPLSSHDEVGCACSALARHCARSLLGGGAPRALSMGVRRAALVAFVPCAVEEHCLSKKPLFFLRKAVLPRASACPHLVRWVASAARLRATALALS